MNSREGKGIKKHISLPCVCYAIVWCSILGHVCQFNNVNVL